MRRCWPPAALAAALLFVQLLLAVHGIGHAFGHDDADAGAEVCLECLALAGAHGAPPPATAATTAPPTAVAAVAVAVPPAPTFARPAPFLSRAPPVLPG